MPSMPLPASVFAACRSAAASPPEAGRSSAVDQCDTEGPRSKGVVAHQAAVAGSGIDGEVIVGKRMRVRQIVDERLDLQLAEVHAGTQRQEIGRRQREIGRIVLQRVWILARRRPLGAPLELVIGPYERLVGKSAELVFKTQRCRERRRGPPATGLAALAGDGISRSHDRSYLRR